MTYDWNKPSSELDDTELRERIDRMRGTLNGVVEILMAHARYARVTLESAIEEERQIGETMARFQVEPFQLALHEIRRSFDASDGGDFLAGVTDLADELEKQLGNHASNPELVGETGGTEPE